MTCDNCDNCDGIGGKAVLSQLSQCVGGRMNRIPKKQAGPAMVTLPRASTEESDKAALARTALRPTVQAAIAAREVIGTTFGELDLNSLIDQLSQQVATTKRATWTAWKAMLTTQATTLDLLFNRLTRQAVMNVGSYAETVEIYLKVMALRAQSQARATARDVARDSLKYPKPVAFFQQLRQHCPRRAAGEQ